MIPSRLNAAIAVAQVASVAALLFFARHARGWRLALFAIAFAIVMNSVYSIIHEAEHGILFESRRSNDAAGVAMALLFPAPFHLIRQGHLGHHNRNRTDDEAFDFWFEGEHPLWKRLQFYGILTGFYWLTVVLSNVIVLLVPRLFDRSRFEFDRPSAAFMDALNPAYWKWIRFEALAAIALHVSIVYFMHDAVVYATMYAAFGFSWSAMQYVHHFDTERDVRNGARNLWLFAPIDAIWLNHNWHLTHHRNPKVPWIHLPALETHERGFLIAAYVRMWRGPRKGERVIPRRADDAGSPA